MDRDTSKDTVYEKTDNKADAEQQDRRATRVHDRLQDIDEQAWKTRVFEMDKARMDRKHTWIGEEDESEQLRHTIAVQKTEIDPPLVEQRLAAGGGQQNSRPRVSPAQRLRSMQKVRIGDRRRFRRLIIVLAVLAVMIAFEASFFAMDARVSKLPDEIKTVNEQTAEIRADNKKLKKYNAELGDKDSKEELKESWKRLRDKVKEAVGETSS